MIGILYYTFLDSHTLLFCIHCCFFLCRHFSYGRPRIYTYRYLDDMGPLRKRTFQNKDFREEPTLATRIDEYRTYL
jgi:hypothetical protein